MEIIILIALVISWFVLGGRISRLEKEMASLRGGIPTVAREAQISPQTETVPGQWAVPGQNTAPIPTPVYTTQNAQMPTEPQEPSVFDSFVAWVKEDWLLKLGAFILLIGFGLFLVIVGAIIGEMGRIFMGLAAGAGILAFGWFRMVKFHRQGSIFLVLGSIVVILAAFTATYKYDMFPNQISLLIMLLSVAFVALASIRYRLLPLAVTSLVLASFAPTVLLEGARPDSIELLAYLFVITLGVVWVVTITGWRVLTLLSLIVFTLYSIPYMGMHFAYGGSDVTLLWYAYAFATLFFVTNIAGIIKNKEGNVGSDILVAGWNGVLLLAWIMTNVSQEWMSLVIVCFMVVFIIAAFAIFAITKRKEPFFVYTGVGIMMLATATAVELEGIGMVIAFILESATLPFIAYLILRDRKVAETLSALTIGPAILALPSMAVNWSSGIPIDHFFVLLLMSATFILLSVFFTLIPREDGKESQTAGILFVVGSVYAYILLWLSLHAEMPESLATMLSLAVYAIIGFASYIYGKMNDKKSVSHYGAVLLTFVAGHLILIESFRDGNILIFFIVGAILVATAFIGRKKHPVVPNA